MYRRISLRVFSCNFCREMESPSEMHKSNDDRFIHKRSNAACAAWDANTVDTVRYSRDSMRMRSYSEFMTLLHHFVRYLHRIYRRRSFTFFGIYFLQRFIYSMIIDTLLKTLSAMLLIILS